MSDEGIARDVIAPAHVSEARSRQRTMEHRWGQRIPIGINVRIAAQPYAIGTGRLRDISVSGGFVQTRLVLPALARICIKLDLQRGHAVESHEIHGHVVRTAEDGVGIEWYDLAPEAIARLLSNGPAFQPAPARQGTNARVAIPLL